MQLRDRYGRLLAYVYIGREMLNETLVRQGYAQVYTVPPNVKYVERFTTAQTAARVGGRGLWAPPASGGSTSSPSNGQTGAFAPDANGNCNGQIKGNRSSMTLRRPDTVGRRGRHPRRSASDW